MFRYTRVLALTLLTAGAFSCAQLEYAPKDSVFADVAIIDFTTANAAVNGLYDELQDADLAFDGYLSMWQYFSDEAIHTGTFPTRAEFGRLDVFPANTTMSNVFSDYYDVINYANYLTEELPNVSSADFTDDDLNSFLGQVRFVRALMYFYIVQGWETSPLVLRATRPDAVGTELFVSKASRSELVAQIVEDLNFAKANAGSNARFYATSDAATAMLSRVHLYEGNYDEALSNAEEIINSGAYPLEPAYENIFTESSAELIFYLKFNQNDQNANAFFYFPSSRGGRLSISPSATLIGAYEGGERLLASIDTAGSYGIKYNDIANGTDPIYFLRAGEIYLNAAEAAAAMDDFDTANEYYNTIRDRAGLDDQTLDDSNYIDLLLQERFVELAMEGGHRLWDLRRTGRALDVLGPIGYDACDDVWPLPRRDIERNPNLEQNACCNC